MLHFWYEIVALSLVIQCVLHERITAVLVLHQAPARNATGAQLDAQHSYQQGGTQLPPAAARLGQGAFVSLHCRHRCLASQVFIGVPVESLKRARCCLASPSAYSRWLWVQAQHTAREGSIKGILLTGV